MRTTILFSALLLACGTFVAWGDDDIYATLEERDSEVASQLAQRTRTQEQFQEDLKKFSTNSRAYIITQSTMSEDSIFRTLQDSTLSYTLRLLDKIENKITLPEEVNTLLGQDQAEKIYATAYWDEAFFEAPSPNHASLMIPFKSVVNGVEFQSFLNIVRQDGFYYRTVSSNFTISNDTTTKYVSIISNIYGDFLAAEKFNANMELEEMVPLAHRKGVAESIYKPERSVNMTRNNYWERERYRNRQFYRNNYQNNNILYRNDLRSRDRTYIGGYYQAPDGTITLTKGVRPR